MDLARLLCKQQNCLVEKDKLKYVSNCYLYCLLVGLLLERLLLLELVKFDFSFNVKIIIILLFELIYKKITNMGEYLYKDSLIITKII